MPLSLLSSNRPRALTKAETLLRQAIQAHSEDRFRVAYRTFVRAIALFERAGDLTNHDFKKKLSFAYERCAYSAFRLYRVTGKQKDLHWEHTAIEWSSKAVALFQTTLGDMTTEESRTATWLQILRLHNLAVEMNLVGAFAKAKDVLQREDLLHRQLAKARNEDVEAYVWLSAQSTLAKSLIGLGSKDQAKTVIAAALASKAADVDGMFEDEGSWILDICSRLRQLQKTLV
jgi:hypothetical protein